jgi:hypothetical protein
VRPQRARERAAKDARGESRVKFIPTPPIPPGPAWNTQSAIEAMVFQQNARVTQAVVETMARPETARISHAVIETMVRPEPARISHAVIEVLVS